MADDLPKLPELLKLALRTGKVIPFVGSGISRAVQRNDGSGKPLFPNWRSYIEILEDALNNNGKSKAADYVQECLNSKPPDYLEAMQIAYNQLGETQWDELLDATLDFEKKDAVETSLELSRLVWHLGSNLIITTNIDKVLQWTCPHPEEFTLLDIQKKEFGKLHKKVDPKCPTVIYLHGHINNKASIIFTKEQYKSFYDFKVNEAKLETLKTLLTRRTFLFLGFSLDDPYFLQQLNYFHKLYDGGADSLFVVIHKNERDNPNIPGFVNRIVLEDFGVQLLYLLKQLASISRQDNVGMPETEGAGSFFVPKVSVSSSDYSRTSDDRLGGAINETRTAKEYERQTSKTSTGERHVFAKYWFPLALMALMIAALSYGFCGYFKRPIESIAVMPFINVTGDQAVEYLTDGMTETLINSLSQAPNLAVKSRSTVFYYKGKETSPKKLGEELNVQAVLFGRVVQQGNDLKLSLEIVNTQTQDVIWSKEYNRKQTDLNLLQSEIAKDVSTKLKLRLSGADEAKVTKTPTANPEAYQAYLRGRYFWYQRTAENLNEAIKQFKDAKDQDPNYALAHAGLADCYALLPEYAGTPNTESIPQAKEYAVRAITLDNELSEPHASLGYVYRLSRQWPESEREFKLAIELAPNKNETAYQWYSLLLRDLGKFSDAASMIEKAHQIAPHSLAILLNVSEIDLIQNNYDASIRHSHEIIDRYNYPGGYVYLGLSYLKQGRSADGIAALEKADELSNGANWTLIHLGYGYAVTGKRREAIRIVKKLEEKYKNKKATERNIAAVYAGLGNKDKAFDWFKIALKNNGELGLIRWQILFESLRDDQRYKDLLKAMGLPE
jgi:TolB-like protein/Tfp pilus assembly protein PilF